MIELLKKHSYFALISGYKTLFKKPSGEYLDGTTIEDIFALFEADNSLRDLFFHAIQIVEKHIKSLLSHSFVEKYGDSQSKYLDFKSYQFICAKSADTYLKSAEVKRLIQYFKRIITPPFEHAYIAHQWDKHKNVPLWVAIKAVTLGTASKMYSLCTQDVQSAVCKEFPDVYPRQLIGMLDFLTQVRNVCAHNERLYDYRTTKGRAIQVMPLHQQLKIGKTKSYYNKGQNDLFAAVVCLKYLLSHDEFLVFAQSVDSTISTLCTRTQKFQKAKILSCMGFPINWLESINI